MSFEVDLVIDLQSGEQKYILKRDNGPTLLPTDYYNRLLLDALLMIIRKDGEIIKKKYCVHKS